MNKKEKTVAIHVRLPESLLKEIDRMATKLDRSRNWVCVRAIMRDMAK